MAKINIPKNDKRTVAEIERDIKKALKDAGRMAAKRLKEPTSTWNHKPSFIVDEPTLVGDDLVCKVYTQDGPYFWLDAGTKPPRRALMTNPFMPKTKPRSFVSGAGVGGLAYVSKKLQLPGIKKREWTVLTALEFGPITQSMVDQVIAGFTPKMPLSSKEFHQYTP